MLVTFMKDIWKTLRGCLHVKTRTGASLIPVWHCHFIPRLHEWTLHVVKRDCDAQVTPYWIGCRRMRVRYPFQTPRGVISCWSEQPNRVYLTSEWVFVPEWKSRPGTVTGVNSRRYDSLWYEILCWCHVTNTEPQEGTGVNSYRNESRAGIM